MKIPSKLCAILLSFTPMFGTLWAQDRKDGRRDKTSEISITICREFVRFLAPGAKQVRVELFDMAGNKVFDSGTVEGESFDWFTHDQRGQPVDSSLFAYTLSVKDDSGQVSIARRGNVIIDRERLNPADAAPAKGDVQPQTAGVFDVTATGGSYNIDTPLMGIGTANPLVRLHVGAGAAPPVTQGAILLVEDGAATSMVMKSTTGGEMFFFQNNIGGVFGTASNHFLSLRTNNLDRVIIGAAGKVGIGTQAPTAELTVAGAIESTAGTIMGSVICSAPLMSSRI